MAIIPIPGDLNDLHHAWHAPNAHPNLPTRISPLGTVGSGIEFLTFHRDFIRKFHAWYFTQPFADQAAVLPWADVPSELRRSDLGWDDWVEDVDRIAHRPETFASADELGQFVEGGVHNNFLHRAAAEVYNEPVLASFHSPASTYFYRLHGLVHNWWSNWEIAHGSNDDARSSVAVFGRDAVRNKKSLYAVTTTGRLAQIYDGDGWFIDFPPESAGQAGLKFLSGPAVFGRDAARNAKSVYAVTTTGRLAQIYDGDGWFIDFPAESAGQSGLKFQGSPAVFGRDAARNTKSVYAVTTTGRLAQIYDTGGWHIDFPAEATAQPSHQFQA